MELEFPRLEFHVFFFGPCQTSPKRIEFEWIEIRIPKTVQLIIMFYPHVMYQIFFSRKLPFGKSSLRFPYN